MPRKPTGQIIEQRSAAGTTFALRFRAYGERRYLTLGTTADGWSRPRAERELANILADVDRGIWLPTAPTVAAGSVDPGFHEFASEWIGARAGELRETTIADYTWQLSAHLLPFFHRHRLSQITVAEVDRYRENKVREGVLSPESINKTITRLGQILAVAEERDLIARNPFRVNTRNRKLKTERRRPVWLDRAEHIEALLHAAGRLDADPEARTGGRRALIATLVLAGLRLGEACALTWRDVDLAAGRLVVGRSKTDAGIREVEMLPALRDELASHRHDSANTDHDAFVFPTAAGTRRDKDNARTHVINPVVRATEALLEQRDEPPLPAGVTAHKLRHTFASLLFALGRDPAYVMSQLGHTDPGFTLRVYAHAMRRDDGEVERLRALVEGIEMAPDGISPSKDPREGVEGTTSEDDESPADARLSDDGRGGFRTCDLSRVKRALSH